MSIRSALPLATFALSGFVAAYTRPTENTWGPLYKPDLSTPVTQGETFTVTWDPEDHDTDGVTVSLVLCHGNSDNCVPEDSAIAEKIPADAKEFDWDVPCDLKPGVQKTDTGYGLLIIVDGTGEFQYSTQFTIKENSKCGGSTSTANSTSTSTQASWLIGEPVSTYSTTDSEGHTWVQTKTFTGANEEETFTPLWTENSKGGWGSPATTSSWTTAAVTELPTVTGTPSGYTAPTGTTVDAAGATTSAVDSFDGAAGNLQWNAAGLVVAAAAAVFAL